MAQHKTETHLSPMGTFFLRFLFVALEATISLYFRKKVPKKYGLYFANPMEINLFFSVKRPRVRGKPWSVSSYWTKLPIVSETDLAAKRNWRVIADSITDDPNLAQYRELEGRLCQDAHKAAMRIDGVVPIIENLRETRYFRTQHELRKSNRLRERGGIPVVVSATGDLILAGGRHRFAIARALELDTIPVAILFCHPVSVRSGMWQKYLREVR